MKAEANYSKKMFPECVFIENHCDPSRIDDVKYPSRSLVTCGDTINDALGKILYATEKFDLACTLVS